MDLPFSVILLVEVVAVALLAFVVFRKLNVFRGRFVSPMFAQQQAVRYGEVVPMVSTTSALQAFQGEVEEVVRFGFSQLPSTFKLPEEVLVEIVPHDLLNQRVRESGVPAVLFGFSTDNGHRVVLSDLIFTLPPLERNRHILHEIWHVGQLASEYHPGLDQSERDAWAFAERYKRLA